MPKKDEGAEKMRGQASRTKDGTLREIRDDTKVSTVEKRYGVDFGVRSDMEWGTLKKELGVTGIKQALEKAERAE